MKKIAVFFPGIGYTVDKPLMHYGRRLAASLGYEIRLLPYGGFPDKVKGSREKMKESFEIALTQSKAMMADLNLEAYDEILFFGKSVGTAAAAAFAAQYGEWERIRLILYTPLDETFSFPFADAVVFTGSEDPWVGKENSRITELCRERGIPCYVYPGADHSLETGDIHRDLEYMKQIMQKTEEYMKDRNRKGNFGSRKGDTCY